MATLAGRPSSSYRLPASTRAGAQRWRHEEQWHERPAVAQFIYLSMLLHAIAILIFGAPPGGSREGRAMWGALNVVLQGPAREIPAIVPKLERELKMPVPAPAPQPTPAAPTPINRKSAPIEVPRIIPPMMERLVPPPLKLDRALPTPKIEVIAVPAPPPVAIPAPLQPIVPDLPRVERTMAEPPKIDAPLAQPIAPPPVVQRPVEVAPPVAVPAPMQPLAAEAPRLDRTLVEPPKIAEPPAPAQELSQPPLPTRIAPPLPPPPAAPVEKRDAPSSGYDPTKPAIDLDAARRRASQMAREGTGQRALLPFPMPAPPERKTRTEEALEKARKPDCRTAYKELGLLAAVPLIANEFGEGSCRW